MFFYLEKKVWEKAPGIFSPLLARFLSELSHVNEHSKALLILVPTSIPARARRDQVRRTWMSECNSLPFCACLFLTGQSTEEAENMAIRAEAERSRDIIQSDIIDSYNNLTLKTMYSVQ